MCYEAFRPNIWPSFIHPATLSIIALISAMEGPDDTVDCGVAAFRGVGGVRMAVRLDRGAGVVKTPVLSNCCVSWAGRV